MPAQNVAVKAVVTPLLIGGASLAGRRFGHHVGGWLVALPLTSGPVAFFLATDHGVPFAGGAAVGMLAGTISQVAFALAYCSAARRGSARASCMTLCVESYIGEENASEGVKLEQQVLITENGQELLSTFPFESALLDQPA